MTNTMIRVQLQTRYRLNVEKAIGNYQSHDELISAMLDAWQKGKGEMNLKAAVKDAIMNAEHKTGGVAIVKDGNDYDTIPGAYLTDVSYSGSRDVVLHITDPSDILGPDYGPDDFTEDELDAYLDAAWPDILRNLAYSWD